MPVRSSTQITTPSSGGDRYSLITRSAFSKKYGSVRVKKYLIQWGLRWCAFKTRRTVPRWDTGKPNRPPGGGLPGDMPGDGRFGEDLKVLLSPSGKTGLTISGRFLHSGANRRQPFAENTRLLPGERRTYLVAFLDDYSRYAKLPPLSEVHLFTRIM